MATTIRDVAAAAGVSITTVSHVLNGQGRVAEDTRKRVLTAANRLGYQASTHAQQLVTRRSQTIAIQVSSFTQTTGPATLLPNSGYFLELLNGASLAAAELGYALILLPTDTDAGTLNRFGVDGVIVVDPRGDEPAFGTAAATTHRLVTTGRVTSGPQSFSSVDNDHQLACHESLEHLAARGYQRPALITTDTTRSYTKDLAIAYRRWCRSRRTPAVMVELEEPPTEEGAAAALEQLLGRRVPPDAILASAEDLALGVLHEAQRKGLHVPSQLGVVSAVDAAVLQLVTPQITAVYLNPRQIGDAAVRRVIQLIDEPSPTEAILVPAVLMERGSTAAAP